MIIIIIIVFDNNNNIYYYYFIIKSLIKRIKSLTYDHFTISRQNVNHLNENESKEIVGRRTLPLFPVHNFHAQVEHAKYNVFHRNI